MEEVSHDLHIHSQPSKIKCGAPLEKRKTMKSKTLIIDEEVQGEKISNLNTEQLIKQVVKNIDDDVISVEIKKRHKSDELGKKKSDFNFLQEIQMKSQQFGR